MTAGNSRATIVWHRQRRTTPQEWLPCCSTMAGDKWLCSHNRNHSFFWCVEWETLYHYFLSLSPYLPSCLPLFFPVSVSVSLRPSLPPSLSLSLPLSHPPPSLSLPFPPSSLYELQSQQFIKQLIPQVNIVSREFASDSNPLDTEDLFVRSLDMRVFVLNMYVHHARRILCEVGIV